VGFEDTTAPLPRDLESAHRLIASLFSDLDHSTRRESTLREQIDDDQRKIRTLEHQLDVLRQRVFGRRSEKGVPEGQQALPFVTAAGLVDENTSDEELVEPTSVMEVAAHQRRKHPGRKPLPENLPREYVEIVPSDEELHCAGCDVEKVKIGEDRTQELDYVPASFVVREFIRPKYACRQCESGVVQAALPARPIEKGRPCPGLLAHVITSKYADHLPLYRLEKIFLRHGVDLSRGTLSEWCGAVADLLESVAVQIAAEVLGSKWVQTDDTPVQVQGASEQPYRNGHIWVYRGSDGSAFYDFTWKRNRDGPLRVLAEYEGYLQADAAPAYDDVYATRPIVEVGCWAHARRGFKEAVKTSPREAAQLLVWIGELYGLERSAKQRKLDDNQRAAGPPAAACARRACAACGRVLR
jgi:transposase